ncbi:MAG: DPP IV N-terminal domain-containing protein [Longimicrobiales bacterium]
MRPRPSTYRRSPLRRIHLGALALFVGAGSVPAAGGAQEAPASPVELERYVRAESFLGWNAETLLEGHEVSPTWLDGDRFWYRNRIGEGHEFVLVDPVARSRTPAFDHHRLASGLSEAADTSFVGTKLPFRTFDFVDGGGAVRFHTADSARWTCSLTDYRCAGPEAEPEAPRWERPAPGGGSVAFERDGNLWVRDAATGQERALTTDGTPDDGYAIVEGGCCSVVSNRRSETTPPPVLSWSPDGRWIATYRLDKADVEELHLLETATGRPKLHSYRVSLPGDSVIPTYEIHVFDAASGAGARSDVGSMVAVNTSCCGMHADTIWKDVRWGPDDHLWFTRGVRSYDTLSLHRMDPATGATRRVLTETSKTYVETNAARSGIPNWRVVRDGSQVIWWSERDGWGHLYLIDAADGSVVNRITQGPFIVVDVLHVDEAGGWVYFTAMGREPGVDPYHRMFYRARLDGSGTTLLASEDMDHEITPSPSGRFFLDVQASMTAAPTAVLRAPDGSVLMTVQEADFSRLLATGWQFPVPFSVKARDGVTDLHGVLHFPSDFDPEQRYPVVDYIYPGPQVGALGLRRDPLGNRGNTGALAELGFIVFKIDALGAPGRSKAFHDAYYGNMRDNGIPDHVAALRQLAVRYPQMDLDRVGIYGHSGGGFGSTDAILTFPDVFKVAVSSAGNHDNRSYDRTWGEKYHGLLERNPDGTDSFDSQANHLLAGNLRGKLLLSYGTLDDNVHPNATLLLIEKLIEHDKDFDLVVMPNRNHGYASEPYWVRRTWDYFVEHLMGRTPPSGFSMRPAPTTR